MTLAKPAAFAQVKVGRRQRPRPQRYGAKKRRREAALNKLVEEGNGS